jgi:hypothetical protein
MDRFAMKIIVFLQGTTLMNEKMVGRSREERVRLSKERDPEVLDSSKQVPIGAAEKKLRTWKEEGAELVYLSAHRKPENTKKIASLLERYNFPKGELVFRREGEQYKDVAERIIPDVIVEDDCESIGREKEMVYPHITPELRGRIGSIIVKEFEGIDHLPGSIKMLRRS